MARAFVRGSLAFAVVASTGAQSGDKGAQQGGDYQKYMSQYAGDYQKYMGGGQQGGSQQGGDYQKYMTQYAGDYQKYMKQGGGQQGGSQQGGSQQGGDYQKYMTQYAGDYQKYMKQGGGQQGAGAMGTASQQLFAEGNMDVDAAGNSKTHDDHADAKVASDNDKVSSDASPMSGPAWGRHFMQQYAGDYMPQPQNGSDPKSWRDTFVKKYAGAYMNYVDSFDRLKEHFPDAPATAAKCQTLKQLKEWRAAAHEQVKTYIPKKYQAFSAGAVDQEYKDNKARIEKEIAEAKAKAAAKAAAADANASDSSDEASKPDTAEDALAPSPVLFAATTAKGPQDYTSQYAGDYVHLPKNKNDTKAWRDAFVKHFVGSYGKYINGSDRQVALDKDAPAKASDCHTLKDLKHWRAAQRSQVDSFIPRPYRTFGAGAVEQDYAENKARIEHEMAAKADEAKTDDKAKATDNRSGKDDGSTDTEASKSNEPSAKTNDEEHAKDDGSEVSAAAESPIAAAAAIGGSSVPLIGCFAIGALASVLAFAAVRPRASSQNEFSESLLAPPAPLAYVDVV